MSVFKAYDLRGKYPEEISGKFAYLIGYFLPELLDVRRILIGHDARESSPELLEQFKKGCCDSGCDIYDMGLSTTPMVYFGTCRKGFPGSVMITASHNDREYNGFKISMEGAVPVGEDNGLQDLKVMLANEIIISSRKGAEYSVDLKGEYLDFLQNQMQDGMGSADLKMAMDCSNGMTGLFVRDLFPGQTYLFDTPDGTFPNHSPNPLRMENCADLSREMREHAYDFGVVFDGDGDRAVFLDETGTVIPSDLMIAVLAPEVAKKGDTVVCDIRTSKSTLEYLEKQGFKPYLWKVGHFFAKRKIRELGAAMGGELAGHYYFRNFFCCDSALYAAILVYHKVQKLKEQGKTLSQLISEIKKYENTGEMNYQIEEKEQAIQAVVDAFESEYAAVEVYDFDGIRLEYQDFWLNIRKSNTEPYLRVVAEASDRKTLETVVSKIHTILAAYQVNGLDEKK